MSNKATILVVDDELGIREGCKRVLLQEGYVVQEAEDGNAGLIKAQQKQYDLLLVDLMMPGIGGMELIEQVHRLDPEIIVVVITGYATIETAVEATKRGAYDYIPKPFTPDALIAVVHRGLEKRALRLEALALHSEREQRLLELAGEKNRMQTIISCMADGVLVVNREEQLVLWNTAAEKMFSFSSTEPAGKSLREYIHDKSLNHYFKEVLHSKNQSVSMMTQEFCIEETGTILMANIAPVYDEEGVILGAVTVLRDITALKEIDKIKSQFVSMVAHELRAPLAAIEGWLEVVLSGEAGGDEEQNMKWLQRAKERAHALLVLVNDLLIINRMEAGKVAQKIETIHVLDLVFPIIDLLKGEADQKNVSIEVSFQDPLPPIQADKSDLEKLITNLLNNAIKYNSCNGFVRITGKREGPYFCLRVQDQGIGISSKDLPYIFNDFYRADNPVTKKIPGTGLGLTIVKKIVDSHLGRIEVESELGKGSTFTVLLPLDRK
jgi:two-component system phosphate regulon sensor histidine kinase PhoR